VTITLPEDVLARLATVHADLGRAIVTLAERKRAPRTRAIRPAEVAAYGNHAVSSMYSVGVFGRYAGGELDLPAVKKLKVGTAQAGGLIRYRF